MYQARRCRFLFAMSALLAQDAPKLQEPEYLGIVTVLDSSGALQPLERQRAKHQSKGNILGFVKGTTIISGAHSPIRFPAGQPLEFVVKLETAGYDPFLIVRLLLLAVAKDNREFVIIKTGAMGFSPRVNDTFIAFAHSCIWGEESRKFAIATFAERQSPLSEAPARLCHRRRSVACADRGSRLIGPRVVVAIG